MSFECLGPWSWRVHGLGRLGIRARVLRAEGSEVKRFLWPRELGSFWGSRCSGCLEGFRGLGFRGLGVWGLGV